MITKMYESFQAAVATGNPYVIVGLAFVVGVLTSFTPCLYPMIPVTMGILQTQAVRSLWSNFVTALSYVLGMASVYAVLGYVAATSSIIFGKWTTNPWFIFIAVMIFFYLVFSMFGFYEIKLPSFLTKHHEVEGSERGQRSLIKSFLFGAISGTVASPCLTPPLAILLTLVAKKGSPFLGLFALFAFALGMGMLLLIIGTFSSSLALLPRAGRWMLEVKRFFGFVMLAMCVYIARPLLGDIAALYLYGVVAGVTVGYYVLVLVRRGLKS